MSWVGRFNPIKSLFFRVFLCFWLAALLIFLSSIWLAKQLDSEVKYLPLNTQQQKDLSRFSRRLKSRIDKQSHHLRLEEIIGQTGKKHITGILLINTQTREMIVNVARHIRLNKALFKEFDLQSAPIAMESEGVVFMGPTVLNVKFGEYLMFRVLPKPGGSLRVIRHEYPELFILFLVSLSAVLCYLFVRGLLNPIIQLQNATKRMASGDMSARVGSASLRLDEIGQLGRDFNHMSEHVETLLNSQKRLLADISHELRSPLTRLQLSIGIALQNSEADLSDNMLPALERIEKEALKIEDMIAQVLLLSRLDSKQLTQNIQSVSLEQLMQPIIVDGQFEAKQKDKELRYYAKENIYFHADSFLLTSAIENILRNAIYYSNYLVEVSVSVQEQHRKQYIVWLIEDDGNGIEESQLSRIFEAFYRESAARDRNSGGVGLGLAIAKHAISKHNGTIQASNRAAGGLKVEISIPL